MKGRLVFLLFYNYYISNSYILYCHIQFSIDRLSLVMLVNKIIVGEEKEIQVVFNHAEEFNLLNEMMIEDEKPDGLKDESTSRKVG